MSDHSTENPEVSSRIKQLENQNIKFKQLLKVALDISHLDDSDACKLQDEANTLKETIENLEKEKTELEGELQSITEDNGGEIMLVVRKLEKENVDLKIKFEEVLQDIKRGNLEIADLRTEDAELKQILVDLENEKLKLLGEIKRVEECGGSQSTESVKLREKVSQIETKKSSLMKNLHNRSMNNLPSADMLINFQSLEKTYKDYVGALQEHSSLKQKVSELENRNDELLKVVQKSESEDMRLQLKLRESIIRSNTDILTKITDVRSKLKNNLELNEEFVKSLETPEQLVLKISQLENEKRALYSDLEQSLEKSAKEISRISENLSDPEIKRLVNEIELQKTVLLYNLRTIKLNEHKPVYSDYNFLLPNLPESQSPTFNVELKDSNLNSDFSKPGISNSNELGVKNEFKPTVTTASSEGHRKLEEEIARLEHEREMLLKRLQSASTTSSQRLEDGSAPNEQTVFGQRDLHNIFMQQSSHEIVLGQNYDDATNQLYPSEDTKLEQRIRELEIENARIKTELDNVLEELKNDKSDMSDIQLTGQVLKEKIEELENQHREF